MDTLTIKVGGNDFTIKPLTFRQMQDFAPACLNFYKKDGNAGRLSTRESFDMVGDMILWAVKGEKPEFARSTLDDMQPTIAELLEAAAELSFFSGLYKRVEPGAGEAKAGETKSP